MARRTIWIMGLVCLWAAGTALAQAGRKPETKSEKEAEDPDRGLIGVQVVPLDKIPAAQQKQLEKAGLTVKNGLLVGGVVKDGPADKAGLKLGDVIIGVGNKKSFKSSAAVQKALQKMKAGKEVKITYVRGTEEREALVTPADAAAMESLAAAAAQAAERKKLEAQRIQANFDALDEGTLPAGWKSTRNGKGKTAKWAVMAVGGAPSGKKALAVEPKNKGETSNLCFYEGAEYEDLYLDLKLKPLAGQHDEGGGAVWRAKDSKNYYLVRLNTRDKKLELYKVEKGKRELLQAADINADARQWNRVYVEHIRGRILCYFGDQIVLDARDGTFKKGKIGLWTCADASTAFDDVKFDALRTLGRPR